MANTRIMYWGGGLNKLDQVVALSHVPCFDEPESADILLLHDVLSDQTDRKDLKSKYESVKIQIKKNAPKSAKVVVIPGQNDDEKLLNDVLGGYVIRGAGEVAGRKIFGINTYHSQTDLTPDGRKKMPLEEKLLQDSKDAEIFVSSVPLPKHYKASMDANKRYRTSPLTHLQEVYLEPWKDEGTSNGQKCKILITPAAVDDFEKNTWSSLESSVILNAGSVYPKPGSHNADHNLARDFAYLIDFDDKGGVSKFRAIGPNGNRLTIFQKPYIFERSNAEQGITRFNFKIGTDEEKEKKETAVRANPETDIVEIVKKAELVYKATHEVNVNVAGVLKPIAYLGQKTPKGNSRLPKSKKLLDAICDITDSFIETIDHNTPMERYHVILSALEKHGTRLKGTVRAHAKRMIKGYAPAIKSNKELYAEILGLEKRLVDIHEKSVAEAKAAKEARKAAREARKAAGKSRPGPTNWHQKFDLQVKVSDEVTAKFEEEVRIRKGAEKNHDDATRELAAEKAKLDEAAKQLEVTEQERSRLAGKNDELTIRYTAADNENKGLKSDLSNARGAWETFRLKLKDHEDIRDNHNRLNALSEEANIRGVKAFDIDPGTALDEFDTALHFMQHPERRFAFVYNAGLAHAQNADTHLQSDPNLAFAQYWSALTCLESEVLKDFPDAKALAGDIKKNMDLMSKQYDEQNRPPEPDIPRLYNVSGSNN